MTTTVAPTRRAAAVAALAASHAAWATSSAQATTEVLASSEPPTRASERRKGSRCCEEEAAAPGSEEAPTKERSAGVPPLTASMSAPRSPSWSLGRAAAAAAAAGESAAATAAAARRGSKAAAASAGRSSGSGRSEFVGLLGRSVGASCFGAVGGKRRTPRNHAPSACLIKLPYRQGRAKTRTIDRTAQSATRGEGQGRLMDAMSRSRA
jgi:hypothetical protein